MPPVRKAGGSAFRKDVAFAETKASDEYELEAAGIVMVPDTADLQNDFAREETIRSFANQFATFAEAGEAGGGIMHAVWPDGWMALKRNEVLDEAEEIGDRTVEAGAWVQRWGIDNANLAALIEDDILEGYSIGAIQIDWDGPYEPDEVDDVDTSEIPDGEMVWELTDGIIRDVSAVDIPAVPDAQILEAKSKADAQKRLAEHVGNQDAFIEEAMERGHSEDDAQRLWGVLNEAVDADGSAQPGKESVFERAGRAFLSALTGSDNNTDTGTDDDAVGETTSEDPGRGATKEGRTLSTQNRESLFATVDAALDILHDAGNAPEDMQRFTDREDTDFDLSEHDAREWAGDHDEDGDDDEDDVSIDDFVEGADDDAPAGETADSTDMSNDNTEKSGEAPEWAASLTETVEQNSKQIAELKKSLTDDGAGDGGGDGDGDGGGDPWADAPGWAKSLRENVEQNSETIETISKQAGYSQQLDGTEKSGGNGSEMDEVEKFKAGLVGAAPGGGN